MVSKESNPSSVGITRISLVFSKVVSTSRSSSFSVSRRTSVASSEADAITGKTDVSLQSTVSTDTATVTSPIIQTTTTQVRSDFDDSNVIEA